MCALPIYHARHCDHELCAKGMSTARNSSLGEASALSRRARSRTIVAGFLKPEPTLSTPRLPTSLLPASAPISPATFVRSSLYSGQTRRTSIPLDDRHVHHAEQLCETSKSARSSLLRSSSQLTIRTLSPILGRSYSHWIEDHHPPIPLRLNPRDRLS